MMIVGTFDIHGGWFMKSLSVTSSEKSGVKMLPHVTLPSSKLQKSFEKFDGTKTSTIEENLQIHKKWQILLSEQWQILLKDQRQMLLSE